MGKSSGPDLSGLNRAAAEQATLAREIFGEARPVLRQTRAVLQDALQGGVPAPVTTGLETIEDIFGVARDLVEPDVIGTGVSKGEQRRDLLRNRILATTERGGLQQFALAQAENEALLERERFIRGTNQAIALAQAQSQVNLATPIFTNIIQQGSQFGVGGSQAAIQAGQGAGNILAAVAQAEHAQNQLEFQEKQKIAGSLGALVGLPLGSQGGSPGFRQGLGGQSSGTVLGPTQSLRVGG